MFCVVVYFLRWNTDGGLADRFMVPTHSENILVYVIVPSRVPTLTIRVDVKCIRYI